MASEASGEHIKKAEEKGSTWNRDTVFKEIKVFIPERRIDTLSKYVNLHDTIVVRQNKVITKLKVDTLSKTIYVNTICPPDTVIKKVPIAVSNTISYSKFPWLWLMIAFLIGIALAFLATPQDKSDPPNK